jgi:hypothetical protein
MAFRRTPQNARTPTTICAGFTNAPTQGLRYRVVISAQRVLDSAITEQTFENMTVPTGTTPSSAVPPFALSACRAFPQETRMDSMSVTRMPNAPNYARVKCNVIIPMALDFIDSGGKAVRTNTSCSCPQDIVLYVPNDGNEATFPYEITAEATTYAAEGTGDRSSTTITRMCVRIVTRVSSDTDLLIPSYGFAPVSPATVYGNDACREFFAQPLYPNGKANSVCYEQ